MKKVSLFLQLSLLSAVFFASCVKDRNVGTDFSQIQPVLELRTPVSNIAGLAYFPRATIGNLADTVQFYVTWHQNSRLTTTLMLQSDLIKAA